MIAHSLEHIADEPIDLPLDFSASPAPSKSSADPRRQALNRSVSVNDRYGAFGRSLSDRRSIAAFPTGADYSIGAYSPNEASAPSYITSGGAIGRSQTVSHRDLAGGHSSTWAYNLRSEEQKTRDNGSPQLQWTPDFAHLPSPFEDNSADVFVDAAEAQPMPMSAAHQQPGSLQGKTSTDSGQQAALDRWSQRRLQRLQTESAFRDQRQTVQSPQPNDYSSGSSQYSSNNTTSYKYGPSDTPASSQQQQHAPHQISQQHSHAAAVVSSGFRTSQASQPNPSAQGLAIQSGPPEPSTSRSNSFPQEQGNNINTTSQQQQLQQQSSQYMAQQQLQQQSLSQSQQPPPQSPSDSHFAIQQDPSRPSIGQSRGFNHYQPDEANNTPSMSNNGGVATSRSSRAVAANRQSVHNALNPRDLANGPSQGGQPGLPHGTGQGQTYKNGGQAGDATRSAQAAQAVDEMTEEEVAQLLKDHKELREKYTKVKKYYFEKEDQVKQLQNSLAHQRLSQSRTSLDDSEYTTRFNRLDGLVAQLSFSIRKSWRTVPAWLSASVNKDAVATGKQEMTAVGRAFISCWLADEVFDKYFHPDLDLALSTQLKSVQRNIRRYAPNPNTNEEEDYLISKMVNWRMATLEGLQDALRSPQCPNNRQQLIDLLKNGLVNAISVYLQDPAPSDLEGGVHMIVELVVSIAIHLPLESRDVVIEYFMPGHNILPEQMKMESGIPSLSTSVADDAAERNSMKSATSEGTELIDGNGETSVKKATRGMLSALTGSSKSRTAAQGKHAGAGRSSSSLHRPESSQGAKDEPPPRVRMAAGLGVTVRGRSVLVKAPIFST